MTKTSDLEVSYGQPAIPGLRDIVTKGLTEHLHSVRPDLEFGYKLFEIPAYADEPSDPSTTSTDDASKPDRQIIGALIGHVVMAGVYIDLLWVDPKLRKTGTGTALMKKVEEFAVERGLKTIFVDTLTFQGPDYYPKLGYKELYRVKAFGEEGVERIYFRKEL